MTTITNIIDVHRVFVHTLTEMKLFPEAIKLYTNIELLLSRKNNDLERVIHDNGPKLSMNFTKNTSNNMLLFTKLREKHLNWISIPSPPPSVQNCDRGNNSSDNIITEDWSSFMIKYSFIYTVLSTIDPTICIISNDDKDKCINKFVDRAVIDISSNSVGIVKRFRNVTGIKTPSIADMTSTLYDAVNMFCDENINEIIVFYIASLLKIPIILSYSSSTRLYPQDANIDEYAIFIVRADIPMKNGNTYPVFQSTKFEQPTSILEIYRLLALEWTQPYTNLEKFLHELKSTSLRNILKDKIGVSTSKQLTQMYNQLVTTKDTSITFTKPFMIEILLSLCSKK